MTLEQLQYNIGEIALKNNLVNAYFAGGSLYELNAEVINEYPVIFLTPAGDHTVKENTTRFSLTIYYVDRLWDDDRNETDICSAAIETLKNIMRQINYLDWVAYVEDEPVIRLFTETERMSDRVAGAYMQIWVETLNASTCPEFLDELGRPMGNYIPGNLNVLDAYATKAWVILQKYADKPWVLEQIANIQLSGGTTQKQVLEMIASALTEYTKTENFATINNSAITDGGDFQLVERSEFNDYSAMTAEELERIIELIGNIPMSSVTENITVLSSVTSSHTQEIISLSADTSALTENLAVLSAYTHDSVSSLTHSIETLSAGTETAISDLSASTVNLSQIVGGIQDGLDVVLDYNTVSAMTAQERIDLYNAIRGYDVKRKIWFLVRKNDDAETQFVPIFGRKTNYIDFVGYYNTGLYTVIYLRSDGSLEKVERSVYTLPAASAEVRGGVKIGSGLTIVGDTLYAEPGVSSSITQEINVISASTVNIENNLTALTASVLEISGNTYAVYDYGTLTAMTGDEKRAVYQEMVGLDAEGRVIIIKLMRPDGVVLFQRRYFDSNRIIFHGFNNGYRSEVIFRDNGDLSYSLNNYVPIPTASSTTKGGVKVGSGLTMSGEVLSTQYQIWEGSQSAYEALTSHDSKTFYVITDLT